MSDDSEGRTSAATISPVERALSLLVSASRVSPPLREAVAAVEDEVRALRGENKRLRDLLSSAEEDSFSSSKRQQ